MFLFARATSRVCGGSFFILRKRKEVYSETPKPLSRFVLSFVAGTVFTSVRRNVYDHTATQPHRQDSTHLNLEPPYDERKCGSHQCKISSQL
jgi:hypothetical protein